MQWGDLKSDRENDFERSRRPSAWTMHNYLDCRRGSWLVVGDGYWWSVRVSKGAYRMARRDITGQRQRMVITETACPTSQ